MTTIFLILMWCIIGGPYDVDFIGPIQVEQCWVTITADPVPSIRPERKTNRPIDD